jgi:hypothetical protein
MLAMAQRRRNAPGFHFTKERTMSKQPQANPSTGNQPQPRREKEDAELNDFERSNEEDGSIDDPGDAQRSSKSEPDGDGEETES